MYTFQNVLWYILELDKKQWTISKDWHSGYIQEWKREKQESCDPDSMLNCHKESRPVSSHFFQCCCYSE